MRRRAAGLGSPLATSIAAALLVVDASLVAIAAGISLRDHVAPVGAGLSLALALGLYLAKEASERRRKTLEACEKQFYDKDLREAVVTLRYAIGFGTYQADGGERFGSHLYLTTLLLNLLEATCAAVAKGLYDEALLREFMGPLARMMIENFLVEPQAGVLPTRAFLQQRADTDFQDSPETLPNLRLIFADVFAESAGRASAYRPQPATA